MEIKIEFLKYIIICLHIKLGINYFYDSLWKFRKNAFSFVLRYLLNY